GCYVSNEFPCFAIEHDRADGRYLARYFSRPSAWEEALGLSTGGTPTSRNRLKESKFLAMRVPLPSLSEQRRLVARIEELAAKIEEAKRLREESAAATTAFVSSLHLDLSNGRILRAGDCLELHEERVQVTHGEEYPQVGVKGFGEGLFPRETITASETTYKTFNRLYAGAVVLSQVKGWEGAVAACPDNLAGRYASPEYRTFRCKAEITSGAYLAALIPTPWFWRQLATLTRGVGARRERIR